MCTTQEWFEIRKAGDYASMGKALGISPVTARVMANRGVSPEDMEAFMTAGCEMLHDGRLMKDFDRLCEILAQKIKEKKRIRVIGDYDVDGVCSSYILEHMIRDCFWAIHPEEEEVPVDSRIPHRVRDDYGINMKMIDEAIGDGVDTIITCDNGISAYDECVYAREKGLTYLVTDHHEIPYRDEDEQRIYVLPPADAVVDPMREDCGYPYSRLCGAGVAFKISVYMLKSYTSLSEYKYLDMAALATVADVMPLTGENRIIVREGLKKLTHTENIGMRALLDVCSLTEGTPISAYHCGFVIGPRINATGRIDSADLARSLLDSSDHDEAQKIALLMNELNAQRVELTREGQARAEAMLEAQAALDDVLVVYLPDCHESLAGLIAGRLKEKYYHPAIVITRSRDGVKGSARSIEGYHMYESLNRIADLFSKFGGHAMAAGLSMQAQSDEEAFDRVEEFRRRINTDTGLNEESFVKKIRFDAILPFGAVSENLASELEKLAPFGTDNPAPLFACKNVTFSNGTVRGATGKVYVAKATDEDGVTLEAKAFGEGVKIQETLEDGGRHSVIYKVVVDEYRGRRKIQIQIEAWR